MRPGHCLVSVNLLLAACLTVASAGASGQASQAFGLPVGADTLLAVSALMQAAAPAPASVLATTPDTTILYAAVAPVTLWPNAPCAPVITAGIPVQVAIAPVPGATSGIQANLSITLTSTSMRDAAGQAAPLPIDSGIVSVGYRFR